MTSDARTARCLCGAVAWTISGPLRGIQLCHCSTCRKSTGAPYGAFLSGALGGFAFTRGEQDVAVYASSPEAVRSFCRTCGSSTPDVDEARARVTVPVGAFDDEPDARVAEHIFVGSKAPSITIDGGAPLHEAYPVGNASPVYPNRAPRDPEGLGARGSCMCGAVAYVTPGEIVRCRICHCQRCRRASGAANVAYIATKLDGLRFTRGQDDLGEFKLPNAEFYRTAFCRRCGSCMPRRDPGRGLVILPMGTLDDDTGVVPTYRIFFASKAAWDVVTDTLPRYDELPPS